MNDNPVHERIDDKWWFWDETWSSGIGPYETEKEARKACLEYARRLNETT